VLACRRVVDLAVAGELVGLLAVLAAALPVALPGDGALGLPGRAPG
jgi:hypothetical protein